MKTDGAPRTSALNWCDEPPWVIASAAFNHFPVALHIAGVREANRRLFRLLDGLDSGEERGRVFHEYLCVQFGLHQWSEYFGAARKSLRNSYVRFLNGWARESNGPEGAVLKSWIQSRFGIAPTFHGHILHGNPGMEDPHFARERMTGRSRTNAIDAQLDLLYEVCQYEINRRYPGKERFILYRGTHDAREHRVGEETGRRRQVVRLNNLVSFTAERERAWEFGSTVWKAEVAVPKIVFFSGLLPGSLLGGEAEFLVLGGDYEVEELLY